MKRLSKKSLKSRAAGNTILPGADDRYAGLSPFHVGWHKQETVLWQAMNAEAMARAKVSPAPVPPPVPSLCEQFTLHASVTAVQEAIQGYDFVEFRWRISTQDKGQVCLTERPWEDEEPFDPVSFIGPTQMKIDLRAVPEGTRVTCEATNGYFGEDLFPVEAGDVQRGYKQGWASDGYWLDRINGHLLTQLRREKTIEVLRLHLERLDKVWVAQQHYQSNLVETDSQSNQEERHIPETEAGERLAATPSEFAEAERVIPPVVLQAEQLSIEDFIVQLERLATLHRGGALTGAQFEQAKLRLLKATD